MGNLTKYQNTERTLDEVFGDTSVPSETTREELEMLRDKIDGMLQALSNYERY